MRLRSSLGCLAASASSASCILYESATPRAFHRFVEERPKGEERERERVLLDERVELDLRVALALCRDVRVVLGVVGVVDIAMNTVSVVVAARMTCTSSCEHETGAQSLTVRASTPLSAPLFERMPPSPACLRAASALPNPDGHFFCPSAVSHPPRCHRARSARARAPNTSF